MGCHTPTRRLDAGAGDGADEPDRGGTNQIDGIKALDMFETPPATPYKAALVAPTGTAGRPIEERARSYLHANCALLPPPRRRELPEHRPAPRRALKDTHTCGATPEKGNQGDDRRADRRAGQPSTSVMVLRMTAPPADANGNHGRMPKLASYVVDQGAVTLISDWITSLTGCPQSVGVRPEQVQARSAGRADALARRDQRVQQAFVEPPTIVDDQAVAVRAQEEVVDAADAVVRRAGRAREHPPAAQVGERIRGRAARRTPRCRLRTMAGGRRG